MEGEDRVTGERRIRRKRQKERRERGEEKGKEWGRGRGAAAKEGRAKWISFFF